MHEDDDGYCTAGLPPRWWWRWVPDWWWHVWATWHNGRMITRLTRDHEDSEIHSDILLPLLLHLGYDRLTTEEKIALMHDIREHMKLPDMRQLRPLKTRQLKYCGPTE